MQVALVGNGPISPQQREEISKANCVVRFNALTNRQALLRLGRSGPARPGCCSLAVPS